MLGTGNRLSGAAYGLRVVLALQSFTMIIEAVKARVATKLLALSTMASMACGAQMPGSSDGTAKQAATGAASHRPARHVPSVPATRTIGGNLRALPMPHPRVCSAYDTAMPWKESDGG